MSNESRGLRRRAGSIKFWNGRLNESGIRNLELTVSNCAQRCRILQSLLNDELDFAKITFRQMEKQIKEHMGEASMSTHDTMWVDGR